MSNFFSTKKFKLIINYINGFGAAIVIIGAMFKILHIPGSSFVIGFGLTVEAIIFMLSAFEPIHEELDWTKAYPELKEGSDSRVIQSVASNDSVSLSEKLDDILSKANIDVEKLQGLERGITSFSEAVSNMSGFIDSANITSEYANQVQVAVKNIETLNNLYVDQIKQNKVQVEANQQLFDNIGSSIESSKILEEEMIKLAENLSMMNQVYSGMVRAMEVKK